MTKDEMVQRLYTEYCTHKWAGKEECLPAAIKHADYFFEHYKPKKKREVSLVTKQFIVEIEAIVSRAAETGATGCYSEWARVRKAFLNGKSVRLKK